jgi:hypothetical protein
MTKLTTAATPQGAQLVTATHYTFHHKNWRSGIQKFNCTFDMKIQRNTDDSDDL